MKDATLMLTILTVNIKMFKMLNYPFNEGPAPTVLISDRLWLTLHAEQLILRLFGEETDQEETETFAF